MTADQYVPPPLLPDGNALQDVTGTASLSLGSDPGIICFELAVGIPPPPFGGPQLVGTIHLGAPGVAGPVVATLQFPSGASSTISCTSGLSAAVLADLFTHPERYYVQVIVASPDQVGCSLPEIDACFFGAIRGQLAFEAVPPIPNAALPSATNPLRVPATLVGWVLIILALAAQATGLGESGAQ